LPRSNQKEAEGRRGAPHLVPVVPEFRERFVEKNQLGNLEKAAQRYEEWSEKRSPGHIAAMRQFMKQPQARSATPKA
jgi:hypothetical protein